MCVVQLLEQENLNLDEEEESEVELRWDTYWCAARSITAVI